MRLPLSLAREILAGSDPPDLAVWSRILAPDAHMRLANRPVVVGRANCLRELGLLFTRTTAVGRGFRELWPSSDGETILLEVDLLPNCHQNVIPVAIIVRMIAPEPLARDVRFYLDPRPLESNSARIDWFSCSGPGGLG